MKGSVKFHLNTSRIKMPCKLCCRYFVTSHSPDIGENQNDKFGRWFEINKTCIVKYAIKEQHQTLLIVKSVWAKCDALLDMKK